MTRFYGFHPRDVDDLTYRELTEYLTQMDDHLREQEKQQRHLERHLERQSRLGGR
ncbi:MAG: hypothetical protein M3O70_08240 [Actinomycetota bacterium]|nr:hypothetical protein [Actinomycetota bacterium]